MRTSMLDYTQLILSKVSFSEALFEKELRKHLCQLSEQERSALQKWCSHHYSIKYQAILDRCFYAEGESVVHQMAG
jgi:hypothetical protein